MSIESIDDIYTAAEKEWIADNVDNIRMIIHQARKGAHQPGDCREAFLAWHKKEFGWLPDSGTHPQSEEYWRGWKAAWKPERESGSLEKALRVLIREAQGVADDHHRPRYTRLDEALESAKLALSKTENGDA